MIPHKIYLSYFKGLLDKKSAIQKLITFIQFDDQLVNRLNAIIYLGKIDFKYVETYKILENFLISDENEDVRSNIAKILISKYYDRAELKRPIIWALQNDPSKKCVQAILESIKNTENVIDRIDLEIISLNKKLGINKSILKIIKKDFDNASLTEATIFLLGALFLTEIESMIKKKIKRLKWSDSESKRGFVVEENKITKLNLSRCKLSNLPESIGSLEFLESLDLTSNNLNHVPNSISRLKNLKCLYLYNNQLSYIPRGIGSLSSLEELWLNNNKLVSLPEAIGELSSLEKLNLGNNMITNLPDSIGYLYSLKKLWVYNNKLSDIPDTINNLKKLRYLNLEDNNLGMMPKSLEILRNRRVSIYL